MNDPNELRGDKPDLHRAIQRLCTPLTPGASAWRALSSSIYKKTVLKGEHLTRQGYVTQDLYYIEAGILRYYYNGAGVEHTGQFFEEGSFCADVSGLMSGEPALQNIDAVEDSSVSIIPASALDVAFRTDHALERFGRKLLVEVLTGAQRRSASLLVQSPELRYANFIALRPETARRMPQYMIASYLGITPEALSRIRRRRVAKAALR